MIEIKSITGVITNSSDEVFTLRTTKSLQEVSAWLHENIPWEWPEPPGYPPFREPEVLQKGSGILDRLKDFGCLWDSHDLDDIEDYKIRNCLQIASREVSGNCRYDYIIRKGGIYVKRRFEIYASEHLDRLIRILGGRYKTIDSSDKFWEYYHKRFSESWNPYLWPASDYMHDIGEDCIYRFLKDFCKWFETDSPKQIPEWWSIPKDLDIQGWVGEIGFETSDENSISWKAMGEIKENLGGTNWHMG